MRSDDEKKLSTKTSEGGVSTPEGASITFASMVVNAGLAVGLEHIAEERGADAATCALISTLVTALVHIQRNLSIQSGNADDAVHAREESFSEICIALGQAYDWLGLVTIYDQEAVADAYDEDGPPLPGSPEYDEAIREHLRARRGGAK